MALPVSPDEVGDRNYSVDAFRKWFTPLSEMRDKRVGGGRRESPTSAKPHHHVQELFLPMRLVSRGSLVVIGKFARSRVFLLRAARIYQPRSINNSVPCVTLNEDGYLVYPACVPNDFDASSKAIDRGIGLDLLEGRTAEMRRVLCCETFVLIQG